MPRRANLVWSTSRIRRDTTDISACFTITVSGDWWKHLPSVTAVVDMNSTSPRSFATLAAVVGPRNAWCAPA